MWCPYDLIFPDEVGRALPSQRVNRQFEGACRDAGVATWKGLGVHALRHAANNLLRETGVDAPLRAQILGHTVAVNEGIYTAENLALAAEALGKMARVLA
jgi:integrase